MGDRANIVIKQNSGGEGKDSRIYLYTHYSGYQLPEVLKSALIRGKDRWNDEPYLARIIFCEMASGDMNGLTGLGISTYETDGGYALLVVDAETQTVEVQGKPQYGGGLKFSFEEYVAIEFEDDAWDCLAQKLAA